MLGTICTKILDALAAAPHTQGRVLTLVETGTAYYMKLEPGEVDLSARSTIAIAQWVAKQQRVVNFYSIDIDAGHQQDCQEKLRELGLADYVTLLHGSGVEMLDSMPDNFFDFVLLDADSGGQSTLAEWEVVRHKMRAPGVVVIDDAFKPANVNKAQFVLPQAYKLGHTITEFYRQAVAISFDADEVVKEARG